MILRSYRICKAEHSEPDGYGAGQYGGRWNSIGNAVVYTSESRSLAVLEILVHAESVEFMIGSYVIRRFEFDDGLVEQLDSHRLPVGWDDEVVSESSQSAGDTWLHAKTRPVLRVPSVIVPYESNFLINPRHPEFARISVGDPEPFDIDPRLVP